MDGKTFVALIMLMLLSAIDLKTVTTETDVKGPDGKVGKFYKVYNMNGSEDVAIKYADNDYGMFKAPLVEYATNN